MAAVVIAPTVPNTPTVPAGSGRATAAPALTVVPPRRAVRHAPTVYRRRRAIVALATLVLCAGLALVVSRAVAGVSWSGPLAGDPAPAVPAGTGAAAGATPSVSAGLPDVYVVEPGDTLWSIAQRVDPDADPRPLVQQLAERAGGAALQPGQRIPLTGLR